ncbi:MAG: hypothetical protein R2764_23810 [Bacteroidales bacterium]
MDRNDIISRMLTAIPDTEWKNIIDELTVFVGYKLKGKTVFGAHSENTLGVEPIQYYIHDAIEKLFSHTWDWKYEDYTITEQLKRIIGSTISENVRKEKVKQNIKELSVEPNTLSHLAGKVNNSEVDEEDAETKIKVFEEILFECSKDDPELEILVLALFETSDTNKIAEQTGWEKKKIYSLHRKLYRRARSYKASQKINL